MTGSEIVEIVSWQLEIKPCRTNIKASTLTGGGSYGRIQRGEQAPPPHPRKITKL